MLGGPNMDVDHGSRPNGFALEERSFAAAMVDWFGSGTPQHPTAMY